MSSTPTGIPSNADNGAPTAILASARSACSRARSSNPVDEHSHGAIVAVGVGEGSLDHLDRADLMAA
ncbi:hypothetical protein ACIRRA_29920 [Nocardia sp. NPDC101769]|uniref:hypothetical protein n=1 Tax=Nocardia sp. NPDC101769 TaxID=3364333 RepID=UPI003800623F